MNTRFIIICADLCRQRKQNQILSYLLSVRAEIKKIIDSKALYFNFQFGDLQQFMSIFFVVVCFEVTDDEDVRHHPKLHIYYLWHVLGIGYLCLVRHF